MPVGASLTARPGLHRYRSARTCTTRQSAQFPAAQGPRLSNTAPGAEGEAAGGGRCARLRKPNPWTSTSGAKTAAVRVASPVSSATDGSGLEAYECTTIAKPR